MEATTQDAQARIRSKALSRRDRVVAYVNERLHKAWNEEDIEQAEKLNHMLDAFEAMTDEDWVSAYEDCHPADQ